MFLILFNSFKNSIHLLSILDSAFKNSILVETFFSFHMWTQHKSTDVDDYLF